MALVEANNRDQSQILNTGFDVSAAPSLTYMLIFVDKNFTFKQSDIDAAGGFYNYVDQQRHASGIGKFFPIGGNYCKPFNINDNDGSDVTETSNVTGEVIVLRNGTKTRTFQFKEGGLVFAKALISLAKAGNLSFIDIDKDGQISMKDNNGTYSGVPTTVNPVSPALASPTAVYKNQLSMTYDPIDYVNGCNMFKQNNETGSVLDIKGLVDVHFISAAAATTTTVTVDLKTKANTDLGVTYGTDITTPMLQLNKLTGIAPNYVRTPLAFTLAYTGGHYVLTFASQVSGTKLEVSGAPATVWFTNDVKGYEALTPVIITIP